MHQQKHKKNRKNTLFTFILTGTLVAASLFYSGQVGAENAGKSLEQQIEEWEKAGIDANHSVTIEKIREYISKNVEPGVFASLYIDRQERPLGIIVLSFTKELSAEMKKEIESLVTEPAQVAFRVVKYTEDQLLHKQREIDQAIFEQEVFKDKGFTVYHTSADIISNKVEIGIDPFTDENAQLIYDTFGNDMIQVVQGYKVELLSADDQGQAEDAEATQNAELVKATEAADSASQGFFARIWSWLTSWFK